MAGPKRTVWAQTSRLDLRRKRPAGALVERDGTVRSEHVANVSAKTLKPVIKKNVDKATYLMTDESSVYPPIEGLRRPWVGKP